MLLSSLYLPIPSSSANSSQLNMFWPSPKFWIFQNVKLWKQGREVASPQHSHLVRQKRWDVALETGELRPRWPLSQQLHFVNEVQKPHRQNRDK